MSHCNHCKFHDSTATRGVVSVGAAWLDSGITPGLIVVDSNRPATSSGSTRELHPQFVAVN